VAKKTAAHKKRLDAISADAAAKVSAAYHPPQQHAAQPPSPADQPRWLRPAMSSACYGPGCCPMWQQQIWGGHAPLLMCRESSRLCISGAPGDLRLLIAAGVGNARKFLSGPAAAQLTVRCCPTARRRTCAPAQLAELEQKFARSRSRGDQVPNLASILKVWLGAGPSRAHGVSLCTYTTAGAAMRQGARPRRRWVPHACKHGLYARPPRERETCDAGQRAWGAESCGLVPTPCAALPLAHRTAPCFTGLPVAAPPVGPLRPLNSRRTCSSNMRQGPGATGNCPRIKPSASNKAHCRPGEGGDAS
jgi:hypothetical protein